MFSDAFLRGDTFDALDPVKVYFVKLIAVWRKLNERANGRAFAQQNHSNATCRHLTRTLQQNPISQTISGKALMNFADALCAHINLSTHSVIIFSSSYCFNLWLSSFTSAVQVSFRISINDAFCFINLNLKRNSEKLKQELELKKKKTLNS